MQDWINTNINQVHLTPDPPNGIDGQCVNLASSWSLYQGGPELQGATAYSIFQNFRSDFYDVLITTAVQPGDLAFWAANTAGFGSAGHVDIVVDQITGSGFRGFDTNWNNNPKAEYVNHNFNGFAGVFRRKGGTMNDKVDTMGKALLLVGATLHTQNEATAQSIMGLDWVTATTNIFNSPEWKAQNEQLATPPGDYVAYSGKPLFTKKG